jgi:hypothetical protein
MTAAKQGEADVLGALKRGRRFGNNAKKERTEIVTKQSEAAISVATERSGR